MRRCELIFPSGRPLRSTSRVARAGAVILLTFSLVLVGTLRVSPAQADLLSEEEIQAERDYWQTRYRKLLQNAALLRSNIAKLRNEYAQAQRRNYPRGGARESFRLQADEAEKELAEIEAEIAGIFDEARASEIPPGWLYEVEDEPVSALPAAPGREEEGNVGVDDRAGRNPIYFEDENGTASKP